MKIAVTYENGQVFQHFGHCKLFCLADTETGSRELIDPMGEGHGALAGFLQAHGVDALICGGIGGGARVALAQAGITLYPGVTGDVEAAIAALQNGTLNYNPDTVCNHHHDHGEVHSGGSHACGEDKHGCGGN